MVPGDFKFCLLLILGLIDLPLAIFLLFYYFAARPLDNFFEVDLLCTLKELLLFWVFDLDLTLTLGLSLAKIDFLTETELFWTWFSSRYELKL